MRGCKHFIYCIIQMVLLCWTFVVLAAPKAQETDYPRMPADTVKTVVMTRLDSLKMSLASDILRAVEDGCTELLEQNEMLGDKEKAYIKEKAPEIKKFAEEKSTEFYNFLAEKAERWYLKFKQQ